MDDELRNALAKALASMLPGDAVQTITMHRETALELLAALDAAQARVRRLEEAGREAVEYVRHYQDCNAHSYGNFACSCGADDAAKRFRAALADGADKEG